MFIEWLPTNGLPGVSQIYLFKQPNVLVSLDIIILVYFSAQVFTMVNILRQLKYGAGGFSYKSMQTLRELFPLINFGCKCCRIGEKNY